MVIMLVELRLINLYYYCFLYFRDYSFFFVKNGYLELDYFLKNFYVNKSGVF